MAEPNKVEQVIIIKKKAAHHGHHGGAWKVAYADFVTAMMALFIVLWLMNSNEKIRKAVAGYFADPMGKGKLEGTSVSGTGNSMIATKENLEELKSKIEQAIKELPKFEALGKQVKVFLTNEGLRVELLETDSGMFFESGNAQPTDSGKALLTMLAKQIGGLPNKVLIEGHTDSRPLNRADGYSNWELSVDRANTARRFMMEHGLRSDQVTQVRGFADHNLLVPEDPLHPSNRRISVIIAFRENMNLPVATDGSMNLPAQPPTAPGKENSAAHAPKASTSK